MKPASNHQRIDVPFAGFATVCITKMRMICLQYYPTKKQMVSPKNCASTTLITNNIRNLNTMNAITKYIQNEHEKDKNKEENHYHSSKKSRQLSNKQKKRWIREQNEILSTCNARVLDESKEKYIGKIRDDVDRITAMIRSTKRMKRNANRFGNLYRMAMLIL
eukprot:332174_1